MISPSMEPELRLGQGDQATNKIEKASNSNTFTGAIECEVDHQCIETENLQEKLSQAEFTIDHLQNMIRTTAINVSQLAAECERRENECAAILEEKRCQTEYESKEINALEAELENLKNTLEIRNGELEKAHTKNANLKNAIIANRYKIFHMHFNAPKQEQSEQMESSTTSSDTTSADTKSSTESTTVESSELSDET